MRDVLVLLMTVGFFGLCLGYIGLCDRIVGSDEAESGTAPVQPGHSGASTEVPR